MTDRMAEELIGLESVLQKPYPLILVKRGTKRRGEKPGSLYRRAAVFASPYYEDPFHPDLVAAGFFKAVWKEISLFLPVGKMEGEGENAGEKVAGSKYAQSKDNRYLRGGKVCGNHSSGSLER